MFLQLILKLFSLKLRIIHIVFGISIRTHLYPIHIGMLYLLKLHLVTNINSSSFIKRYEAFLFLGTIKKIHFFTNFKLHN